MSQTEHVDVSGGLVGVATGQAWPGLAWPDTGLARPGQASADDWPGLARPGQAWPGLAWPDDPAMALAQGIRHA